LRERPGNPGRFHFESIVASIAADRFGYSSGATGTIVVGGRGSVLAVAALAVAADEALPVAGEVLAAAEGAAALAEAEADAAEAAAAAGALGRARFGAGGASGTSAGAVVAADGAAAGAWLGVGLGTGLGTGLGAGATATVAAAFGRGRGIGVRWLSIGAVAPVIAGAFAIRGVGAG
jgi:hypothetical protein